MLWITGTAGTLIGVATAAFAETYPARQVRIEQWAGGFLIGGIALLAAAFPMI